MIRTDTVVIGAGQAGLALSWLLTDAGHEHVVLERGRVAERWRSERWDSFRLLTPNWQTRLPGFRYDGSDPEGFMRGSDVVDFFDRYATSYQPPVRTGVDVTRLERCGAGWRVTTTDEAFHARNVVVATGHYHRPRVPTAAASLPGDVAQIFGRDYRRPDALPQGRIVIVGAGPTGQQIASELARAGREVFIAVGRHRALPRRYRGRDVYWWLDRMGALGRTIETLNDPATAAAAPSAVLAGGKQDLDIHRLIREGVQPVGRLTGVEGRRLSFGSDLAASVQAADANAERFRRKVDALVGQVRASGEIVVPDWAHEAPSSLHLAAAGMTSVVWAAGYSRDYSWINAPSVTRGGEPIQRRGVSPVPGLMFLGLRFMYRRNSNFIDGVGADAAYLAAHLTGSRVSDARALPAGAR